VLNDLTQNHLLSARKYQYVQYNSKDARGIDVALLYNPKYFKVEESRAIAVLFPGSRKYFTRDILWVKGKLDGETVHIYVNHWPSRLGGEEQSAPFRNLAARICKKHIDSIAFADGIQKVIIMGDFNDDPISASISTVLGAKENKEDVKKNGIYNPWVELYKKGIGTLAYQDSWGLFDQILLTSPWLTKAQKGYFFHKQYVFNREFMIESIGQYKGYPLRTYDGNNYRGGYSDHFPTYVVLLKRLQ
ncbi:MAG: endonuclease/exonuclease/phosphatase, partial [Bacteroidota bacterium]